MNKLRITITAVFVCLAMMLTAQTPRYLTSQYKSTANSFYQQGRTEKIGGLKWSHGFKLRSDTGGKSQGYTVFNVGGQYKTLMFVTGIPDEHIYEGNRIATVYADGKKIFDKVIRVNDVPRLATLDITGVRELKFQLVAGMGEVYFGEITLWKEGETPRQTANVPSNKNPRQLMKDLKPYSGNHINVTPESQYKTVRMGNTTYNYGMVFNMGMALIGNNAKNSFFNLQGQYATLDFIAGPVNNIGSGSGSGWITVKGDGKILHEYEFGQEDMPQHITIDVTGVQQLEFQSEQTKGDGLYGGVVEAFVYPAGTAPAGKTLAAGGVATETAPVDPKLRQLPDVCKLISNIKPFVARGSVEKQVYTGESDHLTFSMGGTRFSEGFILYKTTWLMDDNNVSHVSFDLGNEFDYISFTAGYVGKSWAMNNDQLRVLADDSVILQVPMMCTYPNQHFVIPIHRCRKLSFENRGQSKMGVAAFGVADLVVYRGEPVENDLFVHPKPECPDEIDLIDLGKPYIHYVYGYGSDAVFYDGTSQRHYVTMPDNTRINKGFALKTSVHFSLDFGPLAEEGGDPMAGVIGATAIGSSFVAGAVAASGAVIGSTLAGVGAFMMLAAGGEAVENSCAAFNTYGEYNTLTFTVACLRTQGEAQLLGPDMWQDNSEYKETLLIGADQKVVAEIAVFENMKPQTITVPIDGCQQLMFWLANTYNTSAVYFFYDLKLSKSKSVLDIPADARMSKPVITAPVWSEKELKNEWGNWQSTGLTEIDGYLREVTWAYQNVERYLQQMTPDYDIYTYYLDTDDGAVCKAVKFKTRSDEKWDKNYQRVTALHRDLKNEVEILAKLKNDIVSASVSQASAYIELPRLGLGAIGVGKVMARSGKVLKEMSKLVDVMYSEKLAEFQFVDRIVSSAMVIDGRESTEAAIICPLFPGETPSDGDRMLVRNFTL
ncbi:MAG: NPCBM/NEW2 domain-containing protein [bacterium]|uniref:NPCBM/NEW2 domain-containing protein n=1 Tax=Candidatus Aphodosoma intestinipullorum TaxID=2840674 RepID=A0A940DM24_9BACT|nr:NPCBM/NEW2 domain-containing protein [Candidatus Aphodosoma intestinipullorum]